MNTWLTKDFDMRFAKDIMHKHMEEDDEFMSLQEIYIHEEGTSQAIWCHWVVELEEKFEEKYGPEKGYKIAQKVITELLLGDEEVH